VWYPSRKGEGVAALHDRLAGFLSVLIPEVQRRFAGVHKRILLVSHAATVIALARELVGDRSLSFRAACCSLTVLDRKDATGGDSARGTVVGGWTARLLGDGRHLKDGLQRAWGFQDTTITDGEVSVVATANLLECDIGLTLTRPTFLQVINEHGEPGTENEEDEPVDSQIIELSSRM
jgi:transcription factor C subunit 7